MTRRKRKWDQLDESLFAAAVSGPGILPLSTVGSLGGIMLPEVAPASAALLTNPLAASNTYISQVIQAPIVQNEAAATVQKQTQLRIQDELIIAREIVINDAETAMRYKLTKRQTQEEIQKSTGAVVITRGKYRPPYSIPDGERPLYLHISAGAHLKETAERIIAVDRATAIVEEMLKQGQNIPMTSSANSAVGGVKVCQPLSTCVYLGFDADPSLNIVARIRGPNDQYINHIMNETGATVLLRGHGSGIHGSIPAEGTQPLHLFLSCNDLKGLEDARLLADNLLDTISRECGYTRVSAGSGYSAIPLQSLLDGVQSSRNEPKANLSLSPSSGSSVSSPISCSTVFPPGMMTVYSDGPLTQPGGVQSAGQLQPSGISRCLPPLIRGTSYTGYGGIYPQATPLQQVALALRQSISVTTSVAPTISAAVTVQKSSDNSSEKKGLPQKRKFQESPATLRGTAISHKGSEITDMVTSSTFIAAGHVSILSPPKKFADQPSMAMPPPTPRSVSSTMPILKHMAPPPMNHPIPPSSSRSQTVPQRDLKSCSSTCVQKESDSISVPNKSNPENVPDTLIKIMEYGEDDDEDDESDIRIYSGKSGEAVPPKPFWAV